MAERATTQVVVFNGSPKADRGNTHVIARAFGEGCTAAGAHVEHVFLAHKSIAFCRGCFACWKHTPGVCPIADDVPALLDLVRGADLVVFATPLYIDNVTGIMKAFLDRFVPLLDPHFVRDGDGEMRHPPRHEVFPKFAVISGCGFPEQSQFQVLRLLFRRMARNSNTELVAEIYRSAAELLTAPNPLLRGVIARYTELVTRAGHETIVSGGIAPETAAELELPLIPPDKYTEAANRYWDKNVRA